MAIIAGGGNAGLAGAEEFRRSWGWLLRQSACRHSAHGMVLYVVTLWQPIIGQVQASAGHLFRRNMTECKRSRATLSCFTTH